MVFRYSLKDGASSFVKQAQSVAFDLTNDEGGSSSRSRRTANSVSWDKKKKKFIQGDGSGADNVKMVRTENGTKLPASFRSGRFDEWREKKRVDVPKVGERESGLAGIVGGTKRFKHHKIVDAKPLDKLRGDYERRVRHVKKRQEKEGDTRAVDGQTSSPFKGKKLDGRRGGHGKTIGKVKSEIKTVEQIRKQRKVSQKRKAKNARPSRGGSSGRKRVRR